MRWWIICARTRAAVALLLRAGLAGAQVVTAQHDNLRTSAFTAESVLTPSRVNAKDFGKLFSVTVEGDVYAQPLIVRAARVATGVRDVLIVATEKDYVYAFDAALGTLLWRVNLARGDGVSSPLSPSDVNCPLISPSIGITSTPVVDSSHRFVYVVARTKERDKANRIRFVQRLHALALQTGMEAQGGPVEIRTGRDHTLFDARIENQRPALLLADGVVYIAWSGSCDSGPYHGWIMAYDATTLNRIAALNTTPSSKLGGVWQSDAGLAADTNGTVYAITGNGRFDANEGGADYGNSVLALHLNRSRGRLEVTDYFTPSEQRTYDAVDADLGSQGPVLLSSRAINGKRLMVFGSKGTGLYVLDRDHLGGYRAGKDEHAYQHGWRELGFCYGAVAVWQDHVFIACAGNVLRDYRFKGGRLAAAPYATAPDTLANSGATPAVSARGRDDGIVWLIDAPDKFDTPRPSVLRAYDASQITRELYDSEQRPLRDRAGPGLRFAMPTIAAGRVYVSRVNGVDVYGLLSHSR